MFGVKVGWFILSVFLILKSINCVEIKCHFYKNGVFHINGRDGATSSSFPYCHATNFSLNEENGTVSINTSSNTMQNDEILLFYADSTKMSYIPNILFITFPNMEIFWMQYGQNMLTIKSQFLKNAKKLKTFVVKNNNIEKLDAKLFIEAPNLEYINLEHNRITSIHRQAFNGIFKLKGIYLNNNKISNIHPETFSHLISLEVLDLSVFTCVSKSFQNANKQLKEIEGEIQKSCSYELTEEEIKRIRKTTEQNKNALNIAKNFASTLKNNRATQNDNLALKVDKMEIENEKLAKMNKNLTSSIEELMEKNDLLEKTLKSVEMKILNETTNSKNSFLMTKKSIHDQKTAIDMTFGLIISNGNANLDQNLKICQKEVCDLEAKMQAVDEGFERRLQKIEKENFEHALDSRISTP